ncbi:ATP-binding protein [Paenibacillus chitinolyticus]|uniref:HAMP domain-containing sensor histidine kinase n=1 Tax=Paenibacillus chitinolyticus TaxID=79263 RepID=UPI003D082A3B
MIRNISVKFIIGFFLIFSLSFLVLNQTVKKSIQTSNKKIVTSELIGLKNNSNIYVRQAFLINHFSNNRLYFGQMAEEMANDLNHATGSSVGVYTVDGELLYSSDKSIPTLTNGDLKEAIEGKTAYSITYDRNHASVLFSYPVFIDGTKVGILRFSRDFSLLYEQSGRIKEIIFYIAMAIFAAAFLFSYILSRHITIPLVRLTRASNEVKSGNLDVRIRFRRKDEIGRLADNFNEMIDQISRQMTIIRKDRDHLQALHEQEKRFFDNITHELKTPLTSILGYAEIIRKKGETDRYFFEKGMNHIIEESRRLHDMVLKLLEATRQNIQIIETERVDAGSILKDVCESMGIRAQRYKKSIRYEIQNDLIVYGQGNRLRQLFINLLDNSIKYSTDQAEIFVTAKRADTKIQFVFSNSSDPIETDQIAYLFQPFNLGNRKISEEGSVGLGLSISKSIVDEHGGDICMTNENNQTTVTVELEDINVRKDGEPI